MKNHKTIDKISNICQIKDSSKQINGEENEISEKML